MSTCFMHHWPAHLHLCQSIEWDWWPVNCAAPNPIQPAARQQSCSVSALNPKAPHTAGKYSIIQSSRSGSAARPLFLVSSQVAQLPFASLMTNVFPIDSIPVPIAPEWIDWPSPSCLRTLLSTRRRSILRLRLGIDGLAGANFKLQDSVLQWVIAMQLQLYKLI